MQTSILAAIARAKAENRFVSDRELLAEVKILLKQHRAQLEAASLLFNQAQSLIDAALEALSQKFSYEVATRESQEKCRLALEDYLRLIQYSLITDSTEPLDQYLSISKYEITHVLNLPVEWLIEALNYIKANHSLTNYASIAANTYIDYTIEALLNLKETQKKEEDSASLTAQPFWERLIEIGAQVPESEWAKIPRDLATNFEHYMYGAPKEE